VEIGGGGERGMAENADVNLARVEAKLDMLVSEVGGLRNDVKDFGARITKLEEGTREAVPQVWKLKERVAMLERDAAQIRLDVERLKAEHTKYSSRAWEVGKMFLGPIAGAIAGWVAATFRAGLGR